MSTHQACVSYQLTHLAGPLSGMLEQFNYDMPLYSFLHVPFAWNLEFIALLLLLH